MHLGINWAAIGLTIGVHKKKWDTMISGPRIEASPEAGGGDLPGTSSASNSAEGIPPSPQQSGSRIPSVPTTTSQRTSERARKRRAAVRAQLDADQLRLKDWVDSRPPARPQQHAAVDRMAALKARIAARASALD